MGGWVRQEAVSMAVAGAATAALWRWRWRLLDCRLLPYICLQPAASQRTLTQTVVPHCGTVPKAAAHKPFARLFTVHD